MFSYQFGLHNKWTRSGCFGSCILGEQMSFFVREYIFGSENDSGARLAVLGTNKEDERVSGALLEVTDINTQFSEKFHA